jgi:hypothetical protein
MLSTTWPLPSKSQRFSEAHLPSEGANVTKQYFH